MARNTVSNMEKRIIKDGTVEVHYFTPGEDSRYIVGGVVQAYEIDVDKILVDHEAVLESFNIQRGDFNAVINIYDPILGSEEFPMIYLKEISPDRRELRFEHVVVDDPGEHEGMLQSFIDYYSDRTSPEFVLNFGRNQLFKFTNQKMFGDDNLVVRLLDPLPNDIEEESTAWIAGELSDSLTDDNISIQYNKSVYDNVLELRGPNFDVETTYGTVTETDFESWNTLLDANTSTSQNIIDKMFSGSLAGSDLKIDYSGFNNFIHFSSAAERVANFKFKLELIEHYDSRIVILNNTSGSDTTSLQGNVTVNTSKKDNIVGSFDGFERWLYNENTSSLFTDQSVYTVNDYEIEGGRIGAQPYRIQPWPKRISNGKFVLHSSTSALATSWYSGTYATASLYDTENDSSLVKTIPEHIRRDSNNSQYELFVNMIAHHYDIIHSYIDNLSKVYHPQENPKLGQSKTTLYQIAKSLGWSLTDGNQASALWQYKLGVNSGSGAYQSTGTLFSKSDEQITAEVWQRIVNNLPYLLKTKGTSRSIKALMNVYGIPQTLLSIREYGGPKVDGNTPTLIEDRFTYALQFNKDAHIKIPNNWVSSSINKWGIDRGEIPILTHEVRFKPDVKQHMGLMMNRDNDDTVSWGAVIQHTGSYSGSDKYGRIHFAIACDTGSASSSMTEYLPLFDGNYWNLSLGVNTNNNTPNTNTTYTLRCQQASDYISGKIIHKTKLQLTPSVNTHYRHWGSQDDNNDRHILRLGGIIEGFDDNSVMAALSASFIAPIISASSLNGNPITNLQGLSGEFISGSFSGSMQEYRSWLEEIDQPTFDIHTLNPTSYVSSLTPTSSYDTLIRHYPFGTDLNTFDCSGDPSTHHFTSSHPNQTIKDFSPPFIDSNNSFASASGFDDPVNTTRGNFVPVNETYYIQGVSLGGSLPQSQKIRLESNELVGQLSPESAAERSRFDRQPVDTNRLGLFYSMADQINKEIFNQIGDVELDDYIGDPDDQFDSIYPNLESFSREYWKKYTNRNDINAFIRIFSQFDSALFDQINQLLPERVDQVMGLLIEPNALERTKVRTINQPSFTNPQYDIVLPSISPSASGEYINYEASISLNENIITAESVYHTASVGYVDSNYIFQVQITNTGSTVSGSVNEGFVMNSRLSDIFATETFFYSSYNSRSLGQYHSRSNAAGTYRDDEFVNIDNQRFNGSKITAAGINIASSYPQLNYEPIIEVYAVNPNQLFYNNTPPEDEQGSLLVR